MSAKLPIKFSNGTTIGPVTIVCSTVLFLAMIACFVILALYGNADQIATFIRPLIPVLATIGSALLLFVKTHTVQTTALEQGQQAASTAAEAKSAVEHVSGQVEATQKQLNGALDARIANAVSTALAQHDATLTAATTVPAKKTTARKTAAKKTTTKGS